MKTHALRKLKNEYPTSSWALWSREFPDEGCVEEDQDDLFNFMSRRSDKLRPSIVLLSLNPSTEIPSNYRNFHSTDPKHRNNQFRDIVEKSGMEGAYMTDLVERVEVDSRFVEPTSEDVKNLLEQLALLGKNEYHVICFLEKVFQTLRTYFDTRSRTLPHDIKAFSTLWNETPIHCYRVWFHANWGANRDKSPELRDQLSYLNEEVIDGNTSDLSRWIE